MILNFIPLMYSWSFTMYLVPRNGGGIVQIGNVGNNYWRLPNIQKEEFGFWGSFESYDVMVRADKKQWKVIEKTIENFGPSRKNAIAFTCDEYFNVIIFNDFYEGNYIKVRNFFMDYDNFPGSYYEWYVFNNPEEYNSFKEKLASLIVEQN